MAPAGGDAILVQVFVSYAHDSTEHEDDVRFLSRLLVAMGIDVVLDQWEHERHDWHTWATGAILTADRVIAVASPRYAAAADGTSQVDGRAVAETTILRDLLQEAPAEWTAKILPVVLPTHSRRDLPRFLLPALTGHFAITELSGPGIEDLVRVITGQPRLLKPALGEIPLLPPTPEPQLREEPRDLAAYVADVAPLGNALQAELTPETWEQGDLALLTKAGRRANAERIRRHHAAFDAGWSALAAVRLPTAEEDRRQVRRWQESYLRFTTAAGQLAAACEEWASKPTLLALADPFVVSHAATRVAKRLSEFKHQSELLEKAASG
ncbi:hypothetical protein JOD54_003761 [Actinokineospora baliensis]|uniref:SEFIR domain-containing protein n=1 Tax=Actinokineospora baliensis TaxID=547056 RepID=UPI001957A25D|nr:SEFIR domain-containing protein [Actinokineospora baliensis]MBM7773557.1 hypothetical protein [Actinokineospora baliensis]